MNGKQLRTFFSFPAALVCLAIAIHSNAQKPELVVETGHSDCVNTVAFSPDGKYLASAGRDNVIRIWEVSTGVEIRSLSGHTEWIDSIAFSRDGNRIASSGHDNTVRLWNVARGKQIRIWRANWRTESIAFSPDGKYIAVGGDDNRVSRWDVETGGELSVFQGHTDFIRSLAVSPDGKFIASGSHDNTVRIWDVASGKEARKLDTHTGSVTSVAFSPDGRYLASGSFDGTIRIWGTSTWTETGVLKGHTDIVLSVAFSPDGRYIASGSGDKTLRVWNLATGGELQVLKGHTERISSISFSADGKTIASGSWDNSVRLWRMGDNSEAKVLRGRNAFLEAASFSPDGKFITSGGRDNLVRLWKIEAGAEVLCLRGNTAQVNGVAVSPDGKYVVSGGHDQNIRIWDIEKGSVKVLSGHTQLIADVAFSPDGKYVASASWDKTVRIWDVQQGVTIKVLKSYAEWVFSVAFSPDGTYVAVGSIEKVIRIWNTQSGVEFRAIYGPDGTNSVAFSPDGKHIAGGYIDNTIRVWDIVSMAEVKTIKAHDFPVTSVAYSPDGKYIVSGSSLDGAVKIWNADTGSEFRSLKGHSNEIKSVMFSPNGKYIVSAGWDGTIKVWDGSTGNELATLIGLDNNDWLVTTPNGYFDGTPGAWKQVIWRFNNNTFDYGAMELYFNDYFYPNLLQDVMAGKAPVPKAGNELEKKDRRQPGVKIRSVNGKTLEQAAAKATQPIADRTATVEIEVTDNQGERQQAEWPASSGAQDLRLFRNGTLVKVWPGNIFDNGAGCYTVQTKAGEPRRARCTTNITLTSDSNELSAYAFNHDNVKSSDAELIVTGADNLKRKGTAYIIAVGVNEYENKDYNLSYAVPDAQVFAAEIKRQQELLKEYAKVEVIPLCDKDATKRNILLALNLLNGTQQLPPDAPNALNLIKKADPEDLVMVYFAGHGTAHDKEFYLIPHDLGYDGSQQISADDALKVLLAHSISDRNLQAAFEKVDAGHLLLVIDACNSGQALEAEEKRRGPMNSKGLAQLAYEKGMYILTASQSFQAAQEVSELKHGLMTFVLVEEGLKQAKAEKNEKGEITERKWLDYATRRVPEKQLEKMKQRAAEINATPSKNKIRGAQLVFIEGDNPNIDPEKRAVQRPRVFYRRELEAQPLVVARPATANQ